MTEPEKSADRSVLNSESRLHSPSEAGRRLSIESPLSLPQWRGLKLSVRPCAGGSKIDQLQQQAPAPTAPPPFLLAKGEQKRGRGDDLAKRSGSSSQPVCGPPTRGRWSREIQCLCLSPRHRIYSGRSRDFCTSPPIAAPAEARVRVSGGCPPSFSDAVDGFVLSPQQTAGLGPCPPLQQ